MIFGQTNQQKRNKIVKNAENAVFTTKSGIRQMTKKKSTYGSNALANGTKKSITVLQNHINSPLFRNSPVNRKMLMKYRNRQVKSMMDVEKTKMVVLQKNNINRLKKQQQNRNIKNLNRRLAKLKA